MIVNPTTQGWECIHQRAHAWLAFRLLLDFRPDLRARHWGGVLHAALTHDHGWMEWEEAPVDSNGAPCSFIDGTPEKAIKLSSRTVALAAYQCLEGAVLVARHVEELYGSRQEQALQDCLQEIRERRFGWMGRLGWSEAEVEDDYEQVLWADSASLILCVREPEFVESLSLSIRGQRFSLEERDGIWRMDPWPYTVEALEVGVDTLPLARKSFPDAEALRRALAETRPVRKSWKLRPA